MAKLVSSSEFQQLNVGICLDERLACAEDYYRVFFGERSNWKLVMKAVGSPGPRGHLHPAIQLTR
uniref:Uncharacterized protein n=1 Tax=Physcomitrium patens TaxID=3218 RepID=A0A2K1IUS7_PHYPA|nr:hypothetical protein PHYPA_024969 [Physcomitrium patens]